MTFDHSRRQATALIFETSSTVYGQSLGPPNYDCNYSLLAYNSKIVKHIGKNVCYYNVRKEKRNISRSKKTPLTG